MLLSLLIYVFNLHIISASRYWQRAAYLSRLIQHTKGNVKISSQTRRHPSADIVLFKMATNLTQAQPIDYGNRLVNPMCKRKKIY